MNLNNYMISLNTLVKKCNCPLKNKRGLLLFYPQLCKIKN